MSENINTLNIIAHDPSIEAMRPSNLPPEPLVNDFTTKPEYPVYALGETLGDMAVKISDCVQVPRAMAGTSLLAVASLASQIINNVQFDSMHCPISLFCLTVAESGDRKSSSDRFALKPVLDWQSEQLKLYADQEKQYKIDLKVFKTAEQTAISLNKKKSQVELSDILSKLIPPSPPVNPKMLTREPTFEGLQKGFRNGNPSQGLFNDEGGQFMGGHAMNKDNALKTSAGLSKFWDGDPTERSRAGDDESFYLENRRLAAHLMIQPVVADNVLTDPMLLGQGFIARYLIAYPDSLAGTRLYKVSDLSNDPVTLKYNELITNLLNHEITFDDNGNPQVNDIEPSAEAKTLWIDTYNQIEVQLGKDGELPHIKPTAAKIGENILRMSGVFATLENTQEITAAQMQRAILLGDYYLKSFLWIVSKGQENKLMVQANDLLGWIKGSSNETEIISISFIGKKAPMGTGARAVKHARKLMAVLSEYGYMEVTGRNRKSDPSEWRLIKK